MSSSTTAQTASALQSPKTRPTQTLSIQGYARAGMPAAYAYAHSYVSSVSLFRRKLNNLPVPMNAFTRRYFRRIDTLAAFKKKEHTNQAKNAYANNN